MRAFFFSIRMTIIGWCLSGRTANVTATGRAAFVVATTIGIGATLVGAVAILALMLLFCCQIARAFAGLVN